uniref:Uncharacterized protein n=1 Tax=uncultured marine virus TaxID=186617 RepID=A0A0F7L4E7_9VIRU|nr:hypothetical protein [uncultured marine virus]
MYVPVLIASLGPLAPHMNSSILGLWVWETTTTSTSAGILAILQSCFAECVSL